MTINQPASPGLDTVVTDPALATAVRAGLEQVEEIIYQGGPRQVFENEDVMKTIRG